MNRSILHCDMNNFYASVECMLDPSLRKYPVAVCGSVEERHGIVLAKNYAAKAFVMKNRSIRCIMMTFRLLKTNRRHIRAIARESAAHLPLRPDHGGGTYGLWQNNGRELVSGAARQSRSVKCHPHQRIFR